jgi:hypothetical protein
MTHFYTPRREIPADAMKFSFFKEFNFHLKAVFKYKGAIKLL